MASSRSCFYSCVGYLYTGLWALSQAVRGISLARFRISDLAVRIGQSDKGLWSAGSGGRGRDAAAVFNDK